MPRPSALAFTYFAAPNHMAAPTSSQLIYSFIYLFKATKETFNRMLNVSSLQYLEIYISNDLQ